MKHLTDRICLKGVSYLSVVYPLQTCLVDLYPFPLEIKPIPFFYFHLLKELYPSPAREWLLPLV